MDVKNLADAIMDELQNYADGVTVAVGEAVGKVIDEVNNEIAKHITFNQPTGEYIKSFRVRKSAKTKKGRSAIWYVAEPHYRLTHLLENGHALRNGGRSREFPHIRYGEELGKKRMEELTEEAIKNAGR